MDGTSYVDKLNGELTKAFKQWWESLSKEELLTYLLHQDSISADNIRDMLADENCAIQLITNFKAKEKQATADFQNTKE